MTASDYTPEDVERFWSKVHKTEHITDCWEWKSPTRLRYGRFRIGTASRYAHRVAWEITYGEIPIGYVIMHSCDNPLCVNPNHLFAGTQAENIQDMVRKDHHNKGDRCPAHKMTWEMVREIRRRWATERISQRQLGKEFGLSQTCIGDIVRFKAWRE